MAVVAALELDDLVASGVAACQSDRAHRGLGTGTDHAHQLHRRHQLADPVRHHGLDLGGCPEAQAVVGGRLDRVAAHQSHPARVGAEVDRGDCGVTVGHGHVAQLQPECLGRDLGQDRIRALADICLVLMNSNEFLYVP